MGPWVLKDYKMYMMNLKERILIKRLQTTYPFGLNDHIIIEQGNISETSLLDIINSVDVTLSLEDVSTTNIVLI